VPHGHWKTTTLVAGLRRTGMVAPMVLDGPINRHAFVAYVRQVLVPDLKPGDSSLTTLLRARSQRRSASAARAPVPVDYGLAPAPKGLIPMVDYEFVGPDTARSGSVPRLRSPDRAGSVATHVGVRR
jgi:hypothetical protein